MIGAIVPLRSLWAGKSRLRGILQSGERAALIQTMARHVITTLVAHPSIDRVYVLGAERQVCDFAAGLGAVGVREKRDVNDRLNLSLDAFIRSPSMTQYKAVMVLHADLPYLTVGSVDALIAAHPFEDGAALAPDRHLKGTNGLIMPITRAVCPRFGTDSLRRHIDAFERAALPVHLAVEPGLSFDLDTPQDFAGLDLSRFCSHAEPHLSSLGPVPVRL